MHNKCPEGILSTTRTTMRSPSSRTVVTCLPTVIEMCLLLKAGWLAFVMIWKFSARMGTIGPTGVHMYPYAPYWTYMDPYGPIWAQMNPNGPIWAHMDPYGCIWIHAGAIQISSSDTKNISPDTQNTCPRNPNTHFRVHMGICSHI